MVKKINDENLDPLEAMFKAEAYNWIAWIMGAAMFLVVPYLIIPAVIYGMYVAFRD